MESEKNGVSRISLSPNPPVQPVKAKKRWPWLIVFIAVVILVSFGVWHTVAAGSSPASASKSADTTASRLLPSPTPTPKANWQTFLTFTGGNGTKNTQKFEVPADWQFTWSCRGVDGVDGGTIYRYL